MENHSNIRVGIGFDAHRFQKGRKLVLGGVEIPFEEGLFGHSDADVLVHAIIDALLGAAGLSDIGRHFPSEKKEYAGISSLVLLSNVYEEIASLGFRPVQIDSVVICEQPKLSGTIDTMRKRIAEVVHLEEELVNVKAKTTEGMGFTGRREGIAAQAVALVIRKEKA